MTFKTDVKQFPKAELLVAILLPQHFGFFVTIGSWLMSGLAGLAECGIDGHDRVPRNGFGPSLSRLSFSRLPLLEAGFDSLQRIYSLALEIPFAGLCQNWFGCEPVLHPQSVSNRRFEEFSLFPRHEKKPHDMPLSRKSKRQSKRKYRRKRPIPAIGQNRRRTIC